MEDNDPIGVVNVPDSGTSLISSQQQMPEDIQSELHKKDELIESLKSEITRLKSSNTNSPDSLETFKKQYEIKLKDVMEKAREHAKKIGNERDEFKRQSEEKESKLAQYNLLLSEATSQTAIKDAKIADLETKSTQSSDAVAKLQSNLDAMERSMTTPPNGKLTASLSVTDPSGVEWVLIDGRWWKKAIVGERVVAIQCRLDPDMTIKARLEVKRIQDRLDAKEAEFAEYKNKVDLVINDKLPSPVVSADNSSSLQNARKIMKLEEELAKSHSTVSDLKKQISELHANEKSLLTQITLAKMEINKLVDPVKSMETRVSELEDERKSLIDECSSYKSLVRDLNSELESVKQTASSAPSSEPISSVATPPEESIVPPHIEKISTFTQTDSGPPAMLLRASPAAPPSVLPPTPLAETPVHRMENPLSQHDAVAVPLRQQIRALITDLEKEKHDHSMTIEQLRVVKEELRRIEASKKLETDLTDPVKVEYMRNVARKFISLAPASESVEFEAIIPVILNFFGLEGDEAIALMKERQKRLMGGSHSSSSNSYFPKLW